jgi:hypothetical protein
MIFPHVWGFSLNFTLKIILIVFFLGGHNVKFVGLCCNASFGLAKVRTDGLLNFHRVIAGVKTQWIEDYFISLKKS